MDSTPVGTDIHMAADLLRKGELVAIPTETVYGLAGNALNREAVLQIFTVKERPSFDPLIVHIGKKEDVSLYASEVPEIAWKLMEHFWPGPLTILLPKKDIIPDIVTSGLATVGLRMPSHPLTLSLLQSLEFPLAAPSANPFGYISPVTAEHVKAQLDAKISYVLDGGSCIVGLESTIVGFENNKCTVYRLGGASLQEIESVAGELEFAINSSSDPKAPGMLKSHYAPRTPLLIGDIEELIAHNKNKAIGVIYFEKPPESIDQVSYAIQLAADGKTETAARNLFSALREMDSADVDIILAEPVPESGLGKAINDRLKRASVR